MDWRTRWRPLAALLFWGILVAGLPAVAGGAETGSGATSPSARGTGKPEVPQSISPLERESADGRRSKVTVYYFHRKVRCNECLAVEKISKDVVAKALPEPVAIGRLEFRSILLDDKDNWHFVDEFLLTSPSLVIAETRDGQTVRWRNLDGVWDLLGSESGFSAYVHRAIEEFLK